MVPCTQCLPTLEPLSSPHRASGEMQKVVLLVHSNLYISHQGFVHTQAHTELSATALRLAAELMYSELQLGMKVFNYTSTQYMCTYGHVSHFRGLMTVAVSPFPQVQPRHACMFRFNNR